MAIFLEECSTERPGKGLRAQAVPQGRQRTDHAAGPANGARREAAGWTADTPPARGRRAGSRV